MDDAKPAAAGGGYDPEHGFYFDRQLQLWRSTWLITYGLGLFGLFCLTMGVIDYVDGRLLLAGVLFSCSAIAFAGLVIAQLTECYTGAKWFFIAPILGLFFLLLIHGGVENTGPLWCLAFTPGMLYLLGPRWGGVLWLLLIVAISTIFIADLYPGPGAGYPPAVESRFLLTFVGIGLYSLGQDHFTARRC